MQTILPIAILGILLSLQWTYRLVKMFFIMPPATAQLLPANVICLTIPIPTRGLQRWLWSKWTPGTHIRLTIPSLGLLQPHPFTIASNPSEQKIQIYVQARNGLTRRLHERTAAAMIKGSSLSLKVNCEGMYTSHIPCFGKFDVVLLIASGIGVTFTIAILKDVVQKVKMIRAQEGDSRCKRIGFVWIVKHRGYISPLVVLMVVEFSWFTKELAEILEESYGFVAMRLYVTQDSTQPVEMGEVSNLGVNVEVPKTLKPYLRNGRPNLAGLVEQAADEAMAMGRLAIASCGTRTVNADVKNATATMYKRGIQDIYCHAEEFDY
jgi:Ferric reductase NAD binding domain/FAD-binding domain